MFETRAAHGDTFTRINENDFVNNQRAQIIDLKSRYIFVTILSICKLTRQEKYNYFLV